MTRGRGQLRVGALWVTLALAGSACSSEESTTAPVETEAVPVETGASPGEAAPTDDEAAPAEDGRVPVEEEVPAEDGRVPVEEEVPAEDGRVPVEDEAEVSCDPAAILAVLASLYSGDPSIVVVDVDVAECRNGYARVWAIPDMSACPDPESPCLESEQVFLRYDGGTWQYVDSGTGIDCSDTGGLIPETVAACDALRAP